MQLSGKLRPAVFIDRDGVVNSALIRHGKPFAPRSIKELVILDGVKEAISLLHEHGFITVVITNQPDIAHGHTTPEVVFEIHQAISKETGLQNFFICSHNDQNQCECRKPKIGLIQVATQDLDIDIAKSFIIGDRWKDIEAGQRAGCQCFFIDNNYPEKRPVPPYHTVASLLEAARIIVEGVNAK